MAIFDKRYKIGIQIDGGNWYYKYLKPLSVGNHFFDLWEVQSDASFIAENSLVIQRPLEEFQKTFAISIGNETGVGILSYTYFNNYYNCYMVTNDPVTQGRPAVDWTPYNPILLNVMPSSFTTNQIAWENYPFLEDEYWARSDDGQIRLVIFDDNDGRICIGTIVRQYSYDVSTRGNYYVYNGEYNYNLWAQDITQYLPDTQQYPDAEDDDDDGGGGDFDPSSDPVDFPDGIDVSNLIANAGLLNCYHVSIASLHLLNTYLWSSNWFDNVKKCFNSPMECIAGLHILPFSLLGSSEHITLGGIDTEIASEHITNYKKIIDIGTLSLNEYWGNFLDYENTTVKIYLPFVGFQVLETKKVMGASLSIRYSIDVLTGDFQCFLKRVKDGATHVIYTFSGNMAISLPLSQSTNASIMSSVLGVTNSAGSALMGGGFGGLATSIMQTAGSACAQNAFGENRTIQHNGSYGGNKGYLGEMTPYLIIERAKQQMPTNYNTFVGITSYYRTTLNNCHGFTKIQSIHLNCSASADERADIENMLKAGVIL